MIESITNTKQQLLQNKQDCRKYRKISFEEATKEGINTVQELQSKRANLCRKSWSLKRRLRNQYSKLGVVPIIRLIIPRIVNVNE
jgi:sulfur relay (sulfurtransferase) DsrC/TusE family protein